MRISEKCIYLIVAKKEIRKAWHPFTSFDLSNWPEQHLCDMNIQRVVAKMWDEPFLFHMLITLFKASRRSFLLEKITIFPRSSHFKMGQFNRRVKGFCGKKKCLCICCFPHYCIFSCFTISCPLGGSTDSCGPEPGRCSVILSPPWRSSWQQVWRCMILTEMPTEDSALPSFTKRDSTRNDVHRSNHKARAT